MNTKICSKCGVEKSLTSFYKARRGLCGRAAACIECERIRQKKFYRTEAGNLSKLKYRTKQYGITIETLESLKKSQGYKCAICGIPEGQLSRDLHIDHCHSTGKVRGLLCFACNGSLGKVGDNIEILEKMIGYLKQSRSD